jgi:flagellar biosynthesis/type III secretory pathway protein FliH
VSKIISSDKIDSYKIEKFSFAGIEERDKEIIDASSIFSEEKEVTPPPKTDDLKSVDNSEEYIKLLEKVDKLSSEVVELQMKLEEQKKEYEKKIVEVKDEAYNNGMKDAQSSQQEEIENLKIQYISSITSLQELEIEIKKKLATFEEELIETSIIIATKVIKKEVEENSSDIAKSIVNYLLVDIKDELDVKLLVNPKDYEELSKESFTNNTKIVSDNSVKEGGVILLSKDRNIDGTIESRFKRTLQLIKES